MASPPLISVILPTRDRPRFFPMAVEFYRHQTYPHRELIVVDDGDQFPVNADMVEGVGGRVFRVTPGTSIGTKMNVGVEVARGTICQKMDDDDWYAPGLLETLVSDLLGSWQTICKPTISIITQYLFFDLTRWEVRVSEESDVAGAALLFSRDSWEEHPFSPISHGEDTSFMDDHSHLGLETRVIWTPREFMAVRHNGMTGDRNHTWWAEWMRDELEPLALKRPLYSQKPEELLSPWAIDMYRELRGEVSIG